VRRPAALRSFDRAALLLVLVFALGLVGELVWSALAAGAPGEIPLGLLGIIWLTLPIAAAAAFVGASSTQAGATAFLGLEVLLILPVVAVLIPGLDWGGALGLMFMPFLQAGAIILVFLIALAFGWRMRADFLKN
jgi:hypothetical protein